jgi:hypothetical protein
MKKTLMIWAVCLPLVLAGAVTAGVMLSMAMGQKSGQAKEQLSSTSINPEKLSQSDPSQLIVGMWRYAGNSDSVSETVPQLHKATIEYFEDGTYQKKTEGIPTVIDPKTTNGSYVVLSDGRLKTTYEYCDSLPCKEIVNVGLITFPDSNTFLDHYEFAGKKKYSIYKRLP